MASAKNITTAPKELKERLKNSPGGAYVFFGKEDYLKHSYLCAFRRLVAKEGIFELNYNCIDLSSGKLDELEEAVSMLPSMGPLRMVEARFIPYSELKADGYERLKQIISSVPDYLILIISIDSGELEPDSKMLEKKPFSLFLKYATVVDFAPQNARELTAWAGKMFYSEHIEITETEVALLVETCARDMYVIENEAAKLIALAKKRALARISREIIEEFVIPRTEQKAWDMTDALFSARYERALLLYAEQAQKKVPAHVLLFSVQKILCNMLYVKKLREKNMINDKTKYVLGMTDFPFQKLCEQERRFSESFLREAIKDAYRCNVMLNSAKTDNYFLLEEFLLSVIARMRSKK